MHANMASRRPVFEELNSPCFVIDNAGQKLAYIYFEDEHGLAVGGQAAHPRQARRIAANIVKLPELLGKP
jgi:hypothetical protein